MMNRKSAAMTAMALGMLAGTAQAQFTGAGVDGTIGDSMDGYALTTDALASQESNVLDVSAGNMVTAVATVNNLNVLGKAAFEDGGRIDAPDVSDPAQVLTGIEMAIPLSELGYQPVFGNEIFIAGFISSGDYGFLSNQAIGSQGPFQDHFAEPRTTNFNDVTGDQFVAVSVDRADTDDEFDATIDGELSMAEAAAYGAVLYTQEWATSFGDSMSGLPDESQGGSEIDNVYAYVNPLNDTLYVFIGGNLENNFNKLSLFFDVANGGQNTILGQANPSTDGGALQRLGVDDGMGGDPVANPGFTFDTGFEADYWWSYGNSATDHFINYAFLPTTGNGSGTFSGGSKAMNDPIAGDGVNTGATGIVLADSNHLNTEGVAGAAPGMGGGSQADLSVPSSVTTGVELQISLESLNIPAAPRGGGVDISIAGYVAGVNWDFMSNQVVGGLTQAMGNMDPGNLGPVGGVNFNDWDGDQFVTLNTVTDLAPMGSSFTIDGDRASSPSESSEYILLWENTTNATQFGDNLGVGDGGDPEMFTPDADDANGSELNALYGVFSDESGDGNADTLNLIFTGNLEDNANKLVVFVDARPGGQNVVAPGNADIDFGNFANNTAGLTFDTGFEPDAVFGYQSFVNGDTMVREHTLDYANLPTIAMAPRGSSGPTPDDTVYGGRLGIAAKSSGAVGGSFSPRFGLLDSDTNDPNFSNGSELNAIYMSSTDPANPGNLDLFTALDTLYLGVAANLNSGNFDKLEIFFDTRAGGQNTLIGDNLNTPEADGNPEAGSVEELGRMGTLWIEDENNLGTFIPDPANPGLTFDAGFEPDYYLTVDNQSDGTGPANIFARFVELRVDANNPGSGRFLGTAVAGGGGGAGGLFVAGDLETNFGVTEVIRGDFDHSNTDGVDGTADFFDAPTTDPVTVDTGLELAIPYSASGTVSVFGSMGNVDVPVLQWDGVSPIRVAVFINDEFHANISNQVLQHVCTTAIGEPRTADFAAAEFPGEQFVVFDPAGMSMNTPPAECTGVVPTCPGDVNGDGLTTTADITFAVSNLGAGSAGASGTPGDANGDGLTTTADITFVVSNLGCDVSNL